jgi:hypothetical protein
LADAVRIVVIPHAKLRHRSKKGTLFGHIEARFERGPEQKFPAHAA